MARYRWKKEKNYSSGINGREDSAGNETAENETDGGAGSGEKEEPAGGDKAIITGETNKAIETGGMDGEERTVWTEGEKSTERKNYLSMRSMTEKYGQEEKTEKTDITDKTDKAGMAEKAENTRTKEQRGGADKADVQGSSGIRKSGNRGNEDTSAGPGNTGPKPGSDRSIMIRTIVIAAAAVMVLLIICVWVISLNRKLTVIAPIGNITFIDKHRENDICYVTFEAADFNRIPKEINEQGITVMVDQATYDLIALDVEYGSANVVFEVPKSAAGKVGYDESLMNIQNLWTDKILTDYATIRSIVWSVNY